MKAIHVANTGDSRIYYLLESDNESTGVVVRGTQPPTFVNFFSYISKKPNIEKIMDSDFHEFLWPGNKGSMRPRWEHMFIDRVAEPNKLLDGVNVISKFNTDKGPTRKQQMEAKANRAIEYKTLLASGLNEKAFTTRAGRGIGRAVTGSVRGFRRGVRFDPNAIDADMDGFIQEGTQFARPATPKIRTDLTSQRGMRSSRATFMPPKPPQPSPRTQTPEEVKKAKKALSEWQQKVQVVRASIDFNDPEEILQTWKEWESELSELIGRPIKTAEDAREVAALVHPGFHPNHIKTMHVTTGAITGNKKREYKGTGSYFSLLDPSRADDSTYNIYEKHILVAVLHSLKSNPDFKNHTLQIVGEDHIQGLDPVVQPGASAQQALFPGHRWRVNKEKVKDLKAQHGGTREERNALIAADVPSFIETVPGSERPSMVLVGYRPQEDSEVLWELTEALLAGDQDQVDVYFNHLSKSPNNSAISHGLALIAAADSVPEEQQSSALKQAIAVTMGLIVTHELHGHGAHSVASEKHMFDLLKEMREISNADSIKFTRAVEGAFKNLKEKLIKNKNSDKTALDIETTALDKTAGVPSAYSTAVGPMGPAIEGIASKTADPRLPAMPPSLVSIKQWINFAEEFHDRDKLDKWLAQPVLDANGNSFKATEGLVKYFEGIGKAARKEWGVDLRLKEGDELSLAHVLFGLNPFENNSQLLTLNSSEDSFGLTGSIPVRRKGEFSGDQSGHLRNGADQDYFIVDLSEDTLVRSSKHGAILDETVAPSLNGFRQHPQDPDSIAVPHGVAPPVAVFRQKGLPQINDTKPKRDLAGDTHVGTSLTEPVSPEDAAPLLDAYAVASRVLSQSKESLQEDLENVVTGNSKFMALDESAQMHTMHSMFLENMVDIEMDPKRSSKPVGTTGKLLTDFVDGKSEQQREEFREEIVDSVLEMLFFERVHPIPAGVEMYLKDVVANLDANDGKNLAIILQQVTQAASQWDDLSDSRVQALKNIVGEMGYRDYSSYAGARTAHHILEELLGTGRDELVAELMTSMKAGIDLPLWGSDGKRRGLTPSEVDALQALYKWLIPDGTPKIRANGETYV